MANYKEVTVAGAKWVRAWQVNIENKYGQVPKCTFFEETIVEVGDGEPVSKLIPGQIQEMFSDPTTEFNLIHPVTGDVIGTATYQDIYVVLSSLYLDLAAKRDAALPT